VRIVLDTNVLVSGVFFAGPPGRILEAWRDDYLQLVLSPEILDEYQRVGHELGVQYDGVDFEPFLGLLAVNAEIVEAPALTEGVSRDPEDDKFLACAIAAGVSVIVSGDKDLIAHSGWRNIRVVRPRQFLDELLG
jgi:uncharacterized protein